VVDPARVKQILYNYLSNAIKFTPAGGRITIRIIPEGSALFRMMWRTRVSALRPTISTSSSSSSNSWTRAPQNSTKAPASGWHLTKKLAEAHGGRIAVRSAPGEGSTFSVILPRAMTMGLADEAAGRSWACPPAIETILVVDDDPAALKMASLALREVGYRPVCCVDPEDALRRAESDPPGIVIDAAYGPIAHLA